MKINFLLAVLFTTTMTWAQEYILKTEKSAIKWTGKELTTKQHYGSLTFASGSIAFQEGVPASGAFEVDMTSLVCDDLPAEYAPKLEGHLKSDDFFSVESFPIASLVVTSASVAENGSFDVQADLTIKGITHPASFKLTPDGDNWTAKLTFDRSKYDVRFRSGTFFQNLGDKLILDDIVLETKLVF